MPFLPLPSWLGAVLFASVATIVALGLYFPLRWILNRYAADDTRLISGPSIQLMGTLYALILAVANPFPLPARIEPSAFEMLMHRDMANVASELKE